MSAVANYSKGQFIVIRTFGSIDNALEWVVKKTGIEPSYHDFGFFHWAPNFSTDLTQYKIYKYRPHIVAYTFIDDPHTFAVKNYHANKKGSVFDIQYTTDCETDSNSDGSDNESDSD